MAHGYISFEALYDYLPQDDGEIELKVGDHCLVRKPLPQTGERGWLDGVNLRTRLDGQFPGTYCKVFSYEAQPPVKRAAKPKPSLKVKKISVNGHNLEPIRIIKPVWCSLCMDFIWGGDNTSMICTICLQCAHAGCHQAYNSPCGEQEVVGKKSREEISKPVNDWSTEDVLEWMIAARLHPYLHIIKKNKICGADLLNITEPFLDDLGIEFGLHRKIFKLCIDELIQVPASPVLKPLSYPFKDNDNISTHNVIYEHTFTTFQNCDVCSKVMFGIFSQGFMCTACGTQCHRSCAFSSFKPCIEHYFRGRRPSDSEEPNFCCTYKKVTIPTVMRRCVEMIERHGLQLPNIYTSFSSYEPCQALRCALNQNPATVNMQEEYWSDPRCAAYVLKTFLLELPDPLIRFDCYETFLQLGELSSPTHGEITQIMSSLPEACHSHLDYLLRHLSRVVGQSEFNQTNVKLLANVFSVLLIRPEEWDSRTFVSNLNLHEQVIATLIQFYISQNKGDEEQLENEIWFWPNATRKKVLHKTLTSKIRADVTKRLTGTPDGSFIIRPSAGRKGEWTLTIRKGRKERLIKIIQRDGRFGFSEDFLDFHSLSELVKHFQKNALATYNTELNIRLEYPCGPLAPNQDYVDGHTGDYEKFIEIDEELKKIKMLEFQADDIQKLLDECKIMSESQTDLMSFIQEQIDLSEDQYREASNSEKQEIQSSLTNLHTMLHRERSIWSELDSNLVALKHECDLVNAQLTEKSTELPNLQEEHNRLYTIMRNVKPTELKEREDEDLQAIYDDLPLRLPTPPQKRDNLDVLDESYWLFPQKLSKGEITDMLQNKPDGTFLVRESGNYPYAISLVHDSSIKHVPILRGPNGYGFAEPHNTYQTLSELVNHYHHQSLRMHNKSLDTTLQTPYRFLEHTNDGPIYN